MHWVAGFKPVNNVSQASVIIAVVSETITVDIAIVDNDERLQITFSLVFILELNSLITPFRTIHIATVEMIGGSSGAEASMAASCN